MERIIYRKTLDVHKNGIQFMLQGFETADNMSRRIEISLMASGDTIDVPLEQMVAMMYVTTPSATEPSINACAIKDNKVIYDVLPIVEEGITEMQLKLIQTSPEGARRVLCSPKFAVEASKSDTDDTGAEQTTTFTALEDAVAKAKSTYDERLLRVEIDEECIFRAYYADGAVYETDIIRRCIMQSSTELNLDAMIREGITNFTVNEVADEVEKVIDSKYDKLLATAKYTSNLFENFNVPMFLRWDTETENTPYKSGLTNSTEGFAFVYGTQEGDHTIVAWTKVGENFTHRVIGGTATEWDKAITSSGGTMSGSLGLGNGKGSVSADEEGVFIEAKKDNENYSQIKVETPSAEASVEEAAKLVVKENDVTKTFNLFGEHNPEKMASLGYAKIKTGTYTGSGPDKYAEISIDIGTQFVIVFTNNEMLFFVRGMKKTTSSQNGGVVLSYTVQWKDDLLTFGDAGYFNSDILEWVDAQESYNLNVENETYNYITFGF